MGVATIPLPKRADVGYLDPEIAGEGMKVLLDNGELVDWQPPAVKAVIPDYSEIKSLKRYFGRLRHPTYPAWLYHPTEPARIVKNAEEAAMLGVAYRKATEIERGRYGIEHTWDFEPDSWRPTPYGTAVFDSANPGGGKTVIFNRPPPEAERNAMVAAVVAAVMKSMGSGGAAAGALAAAPPAAAIDPAEWEEFQRFRAFRRAEEIVDAAGDDTEAELEPAGTALSPEQEMSIWRAEAERWGVKVDGRWALDRVRKEAEAAKAKAGNA